MAKRKRKAAVWTDLELKPNKAGAESYRYVMFDEIADLTSEGGPLSRVQAARLAPFVGLAPANFRAELARMIDTRQMDPDDLAQVEALEALHDVVRDADWRIIVAGAEEGSELADPETEAAKRDRERQLDEARSAFRQISDEIGRRSDPAAAYCPTCGARK